MSAPPDSTPEPRGLRYFAFASAHLLVRTAAIAVVVQLGVNGTVWMFRIVGLALGGRQDAAERAYQQHYQDVLEANTIRYAIAAGILLLAILLLLAAETRRWLACLSCLLASGATLWVGWLTPSEGLYLRWVVVGLGIACALPVVAFWLPAAGHQQTDVVPPND